jgi:hypothetical protein
MREKGWRCAIDGLDIDFWDVFKYNNKWNLRKEVKPMINREAIVG